MEIRRIVLLALAATAVAAHAEQPASISLMEEVVVTAERPAPPAMEEIVVTTRLPAPSLAPLSAAEHSTALDQEIRAKLRDYAHAVQPNLLF